MRLLLGLEQRFFLAGFGVALGVLDDAQRLFFGAADGLGGDALAVGDPDGEHRARPTSAVTTAGTMTFAKSTTRVTSFPVAGVRPPAMSPINAEELEGCESEKPRFAVWGGR